MNIVVDTNVLLSAVLWKGPPLDALKIILEKYSLIQSQQTLQEFENVIRREKFAIILQKRVLTVEAIVETLIMQSRIFTVSERSESMAKKVKIKDADDLIFVELAFEADAKFIVSGDMHLLELAKVENTRILSVHEFLTYYSEKDVL